LSDLQIQNLRKTFQDVVAVDDIDFEVNKGEFLSLLGPSGCGKTTTLRMIAGFEVPDHGAVWLSGEDITNKPPHKRNIGMVFQNYALFPHMTVDDNVAFGLKMRKVSKQETTERVKRALGLVQLSGLEHRFPRQMSGGQQQRVALARALVIEPQLLLLDEPLSNLDAKLRAEMRVELKMIQQKVGITAIFVTHDQEEALTLSDRIAVMDRGQIVQLDSPFQVYEHPAGSFVCSFLGQENFLPGEVVESGEDELTVKSDKGTILHVSPNPELKPGDRVLVMVKKERIKLVAPDAASAANSVETGIDFVTYMGPSIHYLATVDDKRMLIINQNDTGVPTFNRDDAVRLEWKCEDCMAMKQG
jgi:spermidine/putrescine ABC transporter ATP-binding subunit